MVLDLDGDGIESTGLNALTPLMFDITGSGVKTSVGWIKPDDGLLVLDRNANGTIDSGAELFGDATPLSAGGTASNGFTALTDLDTNLDGKISSADTQFANLRVWRDLNQDGLSQSGELFTLNALNISSINLAASHTTQVQGNGNTITDLGTYVKSDGTGGEIAASGSAVDLTLAQDTFHSDFTDSIPLTAAAQLLPDMQGAGLVRDLRQAASMNTAQGTALANLLTQFGQATTRSAQLALLDNLLDAWADTSTLATTFEGAYAGHTLSVNIAGLATGSQAYLDWETKLSILERFNGRTFNPVPTGTGTVTVNIWQAAQTQLQQSYDTLKASVYQALLLQTRLKPLLDEVQLNITATGVALDFTALDADLSARLNADVTHGFEDFADFTKASQSILAGSGWDPGAILTGYLDSHPFDATVSAALTNAGIPYGSGNGTASNDVMVGSAGNDTINSGSGDDLIRGYDGDDVLSGGEGNDQVRGDVGNDQLYGGAGNDVLDGGLGNDYLSGGDGMDVLNGGAGINRLNGDAGDDQIMGGDGIDTIYGGIGNDQITGGGGVDTLFGGDGVDLIDGGTGDDVLNGNAGSDVYFFRRGDGADRIVESGGVATDVNVLRFAAGIAASDILFSISSTDLVISINGTTDKVTVVGTYSIYTAMDSMWLQYELTNAGHRVERMEFADGTVWTANDIHSRIFAATANDGGNYISGFDTDDVIHGLGGNDVVTAGKGNDTVFGDAGDDLLKGEAGNDVLDGGDGADTLLGGDGNDVIDGGTGEDQLYGGAGNDVFKFGRSSGKDTVYNDDNAAGAINVIEFANDVAPSEITIIRGLDDLYLWIGAYGSPNSLVLKNYFTSQQSAAIDEIRFSNGTIWHVADVLALLPAATEQGDSLTGSGGNDVIDGLGGNDSIVGMAGDDQLSGGTGSDAIYGDDGYLGTQTGNDLLSGGDGNDSLFGGLGNDILVGGAGADFLQGGKGNDTYRFGYGDGRDRLDDLGLAADVDTLELGTGITVANVTLYRDGNDLVVVIDDSQMQLLVSGYFSAGATQIERIVFADSTVWNAATINSLAITGTANATTGTAGNDTFVVDNTGDSITEAANQGVDTVLSSVSWTLGNNIENLTLTGPLQINATGNALDNVLIGNSGNNVLNGGAGSDTMQGGVGDDTYYVSTGYADNVIELAGEGIDTVIADGSAGLAANVENLTIQSGYIYTIYATGNALDNVITGRSNVYGDVYDGGLGADTMIGFNGIYYVDNPGDKVTDSGSDSSKVISIIDWTVTGNIKTLQLAAGSAAMVGTGGGGNNILIGNQNANLLFGLAGDDTLLGGDGADTLIGGLGNDTYYLDPRLSVTGTPTYYYTLPAADDTIVEAAGEGIDTVISIYDYTLGDNLENLQLGSYYFNTGASSNLVFAKNGNGNALNNAIYGNQVDNILDGGAGADRMQGNYGNDIYYVDNAGDIAWELADQGTDTVYSTISYTLDSNVENLILLGENGNSATGNSGNNLLDGSQDAGANVLTGGLGDDTYVLGAGDSYVEYAGEGNDTVAVATSYSLGGTTIENLTLTGTDATVGIGTTADNVLDGSQNAAKNTLFGLSGNDTYIVDALDEIIENTNDGVDTVVSTISSYILGTNLENLTVQAANGGGTGNELNNILIGNSSDNFLDGAGGADTMRGGNGNDTYVVDNLGDVVDESTSLGVDTVQSSISYTLGTNIENLVLTGSAAISGTGNADDNQLDGSQNTAANVLTGGQGNDTYVVGVGDIVVENGIGNLDEGLDTVFSSTSYALGANLEYLYLTGTANVNATGNAYANVLIGNNGNNIIDGGAGVDQMAGGLGDDTYVVDNIGDSISENIGEGIDTIQSTITFTLPSTVNGIAVENLTLIGTAVINGTGNTLDNVLRGNSAANILKGGVGNDTYYVGTGDTVTESASQGIDTVVADITWTLGSNLENLTLVGTSAINGTGNTLNNILTGNSANNTLSGGTGADTLVGGAGNDTYVVDNTGDVVTENLNEGTDLVQSSVTYTLTANVENLTLTGTTAINATGNSLDNVLTGNTGTNTLTGGIGNDTYIIQNTTDVVVEAAGAGIDTIQSSVTYTASANVENLTLTGSTAINATGNALDNVLTGNSGTNTLTGGAGNDTYIIQNTTDIVTEAASAGTDTIQSSVTYTASANVENLTLSGTTAINGTGNALNNILIGNAAVNTLNGAAGNDTLDGKAGADTLIGGAGNDIYLFDRGYGADLVQENDATAGNTDLALFASGIATDQLWFSHVGNNLEVSIIGTTDKLTIQNWYTGTANHVEQFKTADNKLLLDTSVENLVQAMAAFSPPAAGQTTLPPAYQTALAPVLAANWH